MKFSRLHVLASSALSVLIILIVLGIVIMRDIGASRQWSSTRSRLHNYSYAIENYHTDHASYPRMVGIAEWFPPSDLPTLKEAGGELVTAAAGITSPTAYLPSVFPDYFSPFSGVRVPLAYAVGNERFLVWSCGPDGDYDIQNPIPLMEGTSEEAQARLSGFSYDPTNGGHSSGDIFLLRPYASPAETPAPPSPAGTPFAQD